MSVVTITYTHTLAHTQYKYSLEMNAIKAKNIIILPCHSIWKSGDTLGDLRDEWALAPFQFEGSDHLCFKEHIVQSMNLLKTDSQAVLIISGGQTKADSGPILESYSYYQLGFALFPNEWSSCLKRIILEEHARDSFENVLFLICRFYEIFEYYPTTITVVGFEFKRQRFVNQHLQQALLFPGNNIRYIGNSPNPNHEDELQRNYYFDELDASEARHARNLFEKDWYGRMEPLLLKKASRDPFKRCHGYTKSNPSLCSFLNAIGENSRQVSNEDIQKLLDIPWVKRSTADSRT